MTIQKNDLPRGIRNNNPGNIRSDDGVIWRGAIGTDEDGFLQFVEPLYGLRALVAVLIHKYYNKELTTIKQIINDYAPPSENPTDQYVDFVSKVMGVPSVQTLIFPYQLFGLMRGIVQYENGYNPYHQYQFSDAYVLFSAKGDNRDYETNSRNI